MVDLSRDTTGVVLPLEVSQDIWGAALPQSVVMTLATEVPNLPGGGLSVPVITGEPVAAFTGETELKPVSRHTLSSKTLRGHTLSVIEPFSNQFARDLPGLYNALRVRLPGALAKAFDAAVLFGTGAPVADFDTLAAAPEVSIAGTAEYAGLLAAMSSVAAGGGDLSGWAISPNGEIQLLGALDGNGRPLFVSSPATDGVIGSLLGRPVAKSKAAYKAAGGAGVDEVLGIGGDWTGARWGAVEGITVSRSDQSSLTDGANTIHLWQQNMFALRVEIEVGFVTRDVDEFVRLTGTEGA